MKRHPFDIISFLAGLLATGVGLLFLIPRDPVDLVRALDSIGRWLWPAMLLVVAGLILTPLFSRSPATENTEPTHEYQSED